MLQTTEHLVFLAFGEGEVVVSQVRVFLLQFTFGFVPVACEFQFVRPYRSLSRVTSTFREDYDELIETTAEGRNWLISPAQREDRQLRRAVEANRKAAEPDAAIDIEAISVFPVVVNPAAEIRLRFIHSA